jgi:hypothetical protein
MIWSSPEQVQAAIQMTRMSARQCSKVDQVAIFTVFCMIYINLIAQAFIPFRANAFCTHGNVDYFIMLSAARPYNVEWKDDRKIMICKGFGRKRPWTKLR